MSPVRERCLCVDRLAHGGDARVFRRRHRKLQPEPGPGVYTAFHFDNAVMFLDDSIRNRQPKPRAFPGTLCREERIVDAGQVVR